MMQTLTGVIADRIRMEIIVNTSMTRVLSPTLQMASYQRRK